MNEQYVLQFASSKDINTWMDMVDIVKDNFPGFERDDYLKTLEKNIKRKTALCVRYNTQIVGILIFSVKSKCLSCMAVHPKHRRQGIGSALVEKMISLFPCDIDIWVSTFRDNDSLGNAPRALYKKFGFIEDELILGYNEYPGQKFVLRRV